MKTVTCDKGHVTSKGKNGGMVELGNWGYFIENSLWGQHAAVRAHSQYYSMLLSVHKVNITAISQIFFNCLLPTANCQLPTADCRLPTADLILTVFVEQTFSFLDLVLVLFGVSQVFPVNSIFRSFRKSDT